jgi:hypothetical protein
LDVPIYVLGVYISPCDLLSKSSCGLDGLTADRVTAALHECNADEMVFTMNFLRSLPGQKVTEVLLESLRNVGGVSKDEALKIAPMLPKSIERGTRIKIFINSTSGEIVCDELVLRSPSLVRGLLELFFGRRSILTGLEATIKMRLDAWKASDAEARNSARNALHNQSLDPLGSKFGKNQSNATVGPGRRRFRDAPRRLVQKLRNSYASRRNRKYQDLTELEAETYKGSHQKDSSRGKEATCDLQMQTVRKETASRTARCKDRSSCIAVAESIAVIRNRMMKQMATLVGPCCDIRSSA